MVFDQVSLTIAFGAGMLSLISPCVLALVPAYITYLSGSSVQEIASGRPSAAVRGRVMLNALAFVLGFSAIFVAFGASASAIGQVLLANQVLLQRIAGALVVVFGLHVMGVLHLGLLDRDVRLRPRTGGGRPLNSMAIGAAFGAGWAPCVGPILGAILVMAATTESIWQGVTLLSAYSLGMGIPFLLLAFFLGRSRGLVQRIGQRSRTVSIVSGTLLVIIGVMLFTNLFVQLAQYGDYYYAVYDWLQGR